MFRGFRGNVLIYALLLLFFVGLFGGVVYLTLPGFQNEVEQPGATQKDTANTNEATPPGTVPAPTQNATPVVQPENEPVATIVEKVGNAVVKITTLQERVIYDFFYGQTQEEVKGEGSGVIIDTQGHILTNNHVVEGAERIRVFYTDNQGKVRELSGKVLGRDPLTDLAVVQVNGTNLPVAPLGDSDKVRVGETAVAIGNPYGFENTVTVGVVSALNRSLPIQQDVELKDLIQTDAAINPGNSGGALFNSAGQVIGINTAIVQGAQGIGFAIPVNTARQVANELIKNGVIKRPWIGIIGLTVTQDVQQTFNLPDNQGALIYRVVEGGPAQIAGIRPNDVIVQIGTTKIIGMEQLTEEIRNRKIGESVPVVVHRGGKVLNLTLKLTERPNDGNQ